MRLGTEVVAHREQTIGRKIADPCEVGERADQAHTRSIRCLPRLEVAHEGPPSAFSGKRNDVDRLLALRLNQPWIPCEIAAPGIRKTKVLGDLPEVSDLLLIERSHPTRTLAPIDLTARLMQQCSIGQKDEVPGSFLHERAIRNESADEDGHIEREIGRWPREIVDGTGATFGRTCAPRHESHRHHGQHEPNELHAKHALKRVRTHAGSVHANRSGGTLSSMRTSVAWMNDYLEPRADAEEQAAVLTRVGLAFDGRESLDDGDVCQEIETTSNRGDCLCHVGLAREIAAATGRSLKQPPASLPSGGRPASESMRVHVMDTAACPRYTARIIRGVTVGPSPEWMQKRLRAIGQIPRNNLVDCTNFVLFELGQPTHVFDLATLRGGEIRVRRATAGEKLLPLGEGAAMLSLTPEDLVIADGERPVALAGVKGGAESAITAGTRDILLEAATFDGPLVRAMSRRHRVSSDSAYRFQRTVHPADIDAAAARLAALVLETAGGTLEAGVVESGAPLPPARVVEMRPARCRALLGIELTDARMMELLEALGLAPIARGDRIACTIPPRRVDLEREIDLLEEIARMNGLDALPVAERLEVRPSATQPVIMARRAVRQALVGAGLVESVTHTLVSERAASPFLPSSQALLRVDDDRAGGEPILRPSVIPSLLAVRRRNADAGVSPLDLFEFGSAFHLEGSEHRERSVLALLMDAGESGRSSTPAETATGFRRVRGVIERLARMLVGSSVAVEFAPIAGPLQAPAPALDSAATIRWNGEVIGIAGVVTPAVRALFGFDTALVAAEFEIRHFLDRYPPEVDAQAMPAFPAIDRDLSIVVDERVTWSAVEQAVRAAQAPRLESVAFIGVYRGQQTGPRKSVTLRLLFRDPARTMKREEADGAIAMVVRSLGDRVGAELRA